MARPNDRPSTTGRRYPGMVEELPRWKGPSLVAVVIAASLIVIGGVGGFVAGVASDHQELVAAACTK